MVGGAACIAKFTTIVKRIDANAKKAVDKVSKEIYLVSKENYCPVDTGALKSTARDEIVDKGNEYYHVISYGGGSSRAITTNVDHPVTTWGTGNLHMKYFKVDYAWWVHELPYHHYNPPTAQRKYLEVPVLMNRQNLLDELKLAFMEGTEA
jgi:hypothetical protein